MLYNIDIYLLMSIDYYYNNAILSISIIYSLYIYNGYSLYYYLNQIFYYYHFLSNNYRIYYYFYLINYYFIDYYHLIDY